MNLTRKSPVRETPGGKTCRQNLNPNYNNSRIGFNEKPLPSNLEAETRLLENLVFRPEKTALAKSLVKPEDFYSTLRANVYERILEFYASKRAWNWVTLENSFQADPNFLKYEDFLDSLFSFTGEAVAHNAGIIRDCSRERKLIAATYQANLGLFNGEGLESIRACLMRALEEVANNVPTR